MTVLGGGDSLREKVKTKLFMTTGKMDRAFLAIVLSLLGVGLIMLFSASHANAYYLMGNSLHYISKQAMFAVAGIVVMLVASKIDYHIFRVFSPLIYAVTVLLLVLVLFMPPLNNARRWIFIGPINFQPSEIAKFSIVILFSMIITQNYNKMHTFRYGVLPFALLLVPVLGLMFFEPHLSGMVVILGIAAIMMFIGGTHYGWFAAGGGLAGAAALAIINIDGLSKYAGTRIAIWKDPFIDPRGKGFQTIQSLYAIGSGGVYGAGIGGSRQKYLFLPEPQNDFIFAVICEELGFIGATIIMLLFVMLIVRGFTISLNCKDRFGTLVGIGLTAQVGVQALLNIAVVTNTLPNTGISLPFFSYGGTSLLMLLAQMGVVLAISRNSTVEKE